MPQVQVQERIVHVPKVVVQEREVHVPKIEYVPRCPFITKGVVASLGLGSGPGRSGVMVLLSLLCAVTSSARLAD